jgi:hypothetical protein
MRYPWTCQESVGNLGTPKLPWGKVLSQKLAFDGQGSKRKQLQFLKEISSVNEGIDLFSSGGKCCNPTLGEWRMKLTLPKLGLGSPLGLPKLQSSIAGVKTPCIGVFFISLKSYWSVDVENGLAWAIWTSIAQVMAKRRVGSQIGRLTPDH